MNITKEEFFFAIVFSFCLGMGVFVLLTPGRPSIARTYWHPLPKVEVVPCKLAHNLERRQGNCWLIRNGFGSLFDADGKSYSICFELKDSTKPWNDGKSFTAELCK